MPVRINLSRDEARRIALAAQGFDRARPRGQVDVRHLRHTIRQLGLLQIDFVNVLVPAHYLVPFSRLGPYRRSCLDDLIYRRRELMEAWAHEASILPVESWPLLRHRRTAHRLRPWGFETFVVDNPGYVKWVLDQVRARGPLTADDLPAPAGAPRRISDAWGWGLAVKRQVFEAHFGFGRLAVAGRRPTMARVYDLTRRVIPAEQLHKKMNKAEAQRDLVRQAARSHGISTAGDLADYYRMPARDTRRCIQELLAAGELREVRVEGWRGPGYLHAQARVPRRIDACAVLSPFDPLVWTRSRAERVFGFEYSIEIYVPAPRRRWGYYVLPFLLGDRLVARVDLKADRKKRCLLVPSAYVESGRRPAVVADALAAELRTLASWLKLDSIKVGRRGDLAAALASAVRH